MSTPPSLLEEVLPRFDASEVHDVWVAARPHVVFAAARQVTVREVRLLRPLEALRALPGLLARRLAFRPNPSARVLDQFTTGVVPLGERVGAEIAAGAIGRFWRLVGNESVAVRTREDFLSFDDPGYAKAAISFLISPGARRQPRHHRDPRRRHESRGNAGVAALLACDPALERGDPQELARRDPAPRASRRLGSRHRGSTPRIRLRQHHRSMFAVIRMKTQQATEASRMRKLVVTENITLDASSTRARAGSRPQRRAPDWVRLAHI
jgi:hypothetical protein